MLPIHILFARAKGEVLLQERMLTQKLHMHKTGSGFVCHGSICDTCPQGRPRVARPSKVRMKNIGREESRGS